MQIEQDQSVCPACGAEGLQIFPVLHHMICAYVGPEYDFIPAAYFLLVANRTDVPGTPPARKGDCCTAGFRAPPSPVWVMCGRRLIGKSFLTLMQHWSGAVMCPAC